MTVFDLLSLASALFLFGLCGRMAVLAAAIFVASYAIVLVLAGVMAPRRYIARGVPRCFDDWCVTAVGVQPSGQPRATHPAAGQRCLGRVGRSQRTPLPSG